jgi:hypothetical protein
MDLGTFATIVNSLAIIVVAIAVIIHIGRPH